jgi:hypothetical protein
MCKKLTIALVTVLIASAWSCGTAFAEYKGSVWEINGSAVKESVAIKAKSVGGIKLEDSKTIAGSVSIECGETSEGKVSPEGKGEITSISLAECKSVKACEAGTDITAKAVHLPWDTQLEEIEGQVRDKISSSGAGAPGWLIECLVIGVKTADECTGETTAHVSVVSGGVDLIFDSGSMPVACTVGGTGSGFIAGTTLDESPSGQKLQVGQAICEFSHTLEVEFEFNIGEQLPITITNEGISTIELTKEEIIGAERAKFGLEESSKCIGVLITTGKTCTVRVELLNVTAKEATYRGIVNCLAGAKSIQFTVPLKT